MQASQIMSGNPTTAKGWELDVIAAVIIGGTSLMGGEGSIRGTLVGFWCPEYAKTLNLAGYHLHFISDDRKSGGHLLGCTLREGWAAAEAKHELRLNLPRNEAFLDVRIGGGAAADSALKAAESGK